MMMNDDDKADQHSPDWSWLSALQAAGQAGRGEGGGGGGWLTDQAYVMSWLSPASASYPCLSVRPDRCEMLNNKA